MDKNERIVSFKIWVYLDHNLFGSFFMFLLTLVITTGYGSNKQINTVLIKTVKKFSNVIGYQQPDLSINFIVQLYSSCL